MSWCWTIRDETSKTLMNTDREDTLVGLIIGKGLSVLIGAFNGGKSLFRGAMWFSLTRRVN